MSYSPPNKEQRTKLKELYDSWYADEKENLPVSVSLEYFVASSDRNAFPGLCEQTLIALESILGEDTSTKFLVQCNIGWAAHQEKRPPNEADRADLDKVIRSLRSVMNFLICQDDNGIESQQRSGLILDVLYQISPEFSAKHFPLLQQLSALSRDFESLAVHLRTERAQDLEGGQGYGGSVFVAEQLAICMYESQVAPTATVPVDAATLEQLSKKMSTCFSFLLFLVLRDLGMLSPQQLASLEKKEAKRYKALSEIRNDRSLSNPQKSKIGHELWAQQELIDQATTMRSLSGQVLVSLRERKMLPERYRTVRKNRRR